MPLPLLIVILLYHQSYAYMLQVPYLNFYVLPFKWGPCASTVALLKLEGAMLPLTLALSVVAAYVLTSVPVRKATCFMMDPTWANRLVGLARDTERKPFVLSAIACALLYALPEAFEAQRKLGAPPKPGAAWEQGARKSPRKLPHHKSPVKGKADAAAARWARAEGYLAKGNAQKQAVMTNARWRN